MIVQDKAQQIGNIQYTGNSTVVVGRSRLVVAVVIAFEAGLPRVRKKMS